MKNTIKLALALATGAAFAGPAHAAYTINITEFRDIGGNKVKFVGSGSLNTNDLSRGETDSYYPSLIDPSYNIISIGGVRGRDAYSGISLPTLFGSHTISRTNETLGSSGAGISLFGNINDAYSAFFDAPSGSNVLLVPNDYVSGTDLGFAQSVFFGTFAELGLTRGSYVSTWGSGINADSITVNVGPIITSAIPEPTSWILMIAGFAMIAGTTRYRRRSHNATYA